MNKETIKRYKNEFDAWLDGAEIEYKAQADDEWTSANWHPGWMSGFQYRVQPREPMVFWAEITKHGEYVLYTSYHDAHNCMSLGSKILKVVEDLDEDN